MDYKVLLAYGYTEGKYGVNHGFSLEDGTAEYDSDAIQTALAEMLDVEPHDSDPGFEWDCLELELPENLVARIRADAIADYQKATGFEKEVTEVCPHCEAEVTLMWNTETDGYKAFCPHCGKRLMLCDACQQDGEQQGKCDYCSETDSCKHNPPRGKKNNKADSPAAKECSRVVVTKLDIFCQYCTHFFDADNEYHDLECSVNNGYNCDHPDQEETETVSREDGGDDVKIGCCRATACPMGYCPTNADLVEWGFMDEDDVEDGCMEFSNKDFLVVTDSKMVEMLVARGFVPRILPD